MEILLLWIDDLDDAVGALRHLASKILGFLAALFLFAATGFAFLRAPEATSAVVGIILSASLFESVRRRRVDRARLRQD